MNERILTEMLLRDPLNDVLAAMLTDVLIEEKELDRPRANVEVEIIRVRGIQLKQQAQAAAHVREGSPYRARIHNLIREYTGCLYAEAFTLIVETGNAPPTVKGVKRQYGPDFWCGWTVSVGAAWVLVNVDVMRQNEARARKRSNSKRDRGSK